MSQSCRLLAAVLGLCLGILPPPLLPGEAGLSGWGTAQAQDDDGGDDDGGDDDDGGGGGARARDDGREAPAGGGGKAEKPRKRGGAAKPSPPARARAAPPPLFAPEIVVSDLQAADLDLLLAEGFVLIERRQIQTLALTLDRLGPPPGLDLAAARDRVRALTSGRNADFNHYYRTSAGEDCGHANCAAWDMVGWDGCARPGDGDLPIGLIDTGINPKHEILAGARLEVLPRAGEQASGAVHGTAVASLLVGAAGSRVPGLVPGARLLAVDVFREAAGDARADVADLIHGLDQLATRQVRLYSLSLAGPENTVLTLMLDRLTDPAALDAVVVAAAGNGGPGAEPAWPAAHPRVLAVTAVDARGRVYGKAQRGDHLALSAPGVGLLAATSVRGAKARSGTSFAVPFVTAAAALILGRPDPQTGAAPPAAAVRAALTGAAVDLGARGRDAVFGHGLLSLGPFCAVEGAARE